MSTMAAAGLDRSPSPGWAWLTSATWARTAPAVGLVVGDDVSRGVEAGGVEEIGAEIAGLDDGDPDAQRPHLVGQRLAESLERELAEQ